MFKESEIHPHVPEEKAHLFTSENSGSTEYEYLEFLEALVRITKPEIIIETGSLYGYGTLSILKAIRKNGFGKLISIETDPLMVAATLERTKEYSSMLEMITGDSLEVIPKLNCTVNFAFLDSELIIRHKELEAGINSNRFVSGTFFAIHDTSPYRMFDNTGLPSPETKILRDGMNSLKDKITNVCDFTLSRGMIIGSVK